MAFATPNCYLPSQPLNSSSNSCNRPRRTLLHATMSLSNSKPKPPTKTTAAATTAIAPIPISSSSASTTLTPESHTATPKHCYRKGSDVLVEALEREGVTHVFAYPGGATMEIHQSLTHPTTPITTILPRHEQGGIFAAEGYARASGRPGVCIATSGPGATNLISGLADAMLDSIPLVAITGQVPRNLIGTDAFQEVPIVEITKSITKHNFLVLKAEDISRVVREAFFIATSGRPGPVLIDIPKDVQQEMIVSGWDAPLDINGYISRLPKLPKEEPLEKITALISESKKPVLYVGGGCVNSSEELREFVDLTGIPVASTLMGLGNFQGNHELSLGMLGMHGTMYANYAVDRSDLLLAFGVRFDDRVTGKIDKFASRAKIVHIDIDPAEIGKNKQPDVSICGDIKLALREINNLLEKRIQPLDFSAWKNELNEYRNRYPLRYQTFGEEILPQHAIQTLQELTNGNAIISTGVGQHQMFAAQYYNFNGPRQWLSSSGLGAMGFGLPAAIGAALAKPDATVIDIDGDGSFMMNVQELATVRVENLPVKIMILNNQHLGMVVQWEDRFYKSNRAHTYLGNEGGGSGDVFPDMLKFAEACGIPAARVSQRSEMKGAVKKMLETPGPYLLDVIVPHQEHVLPMIPSGGSFRDVIC